MNKKGFTLVELLVTITILAIVSLIAVPNVMQMMEDNQKEKVINDAVSLVALAKYKVAGDSDFRYSLDEEGIKLSLGELDNISDITLDPDGGLYDRDNSYAIISNKDGSIEYCIYLKSDNWLIENEGNCLSEKLLFGDNAKRFVKSN